MVRQDILAFLRGGDRRTIGHSNRVAAIVSKDPKLFPQLIAGLWSPDPLVRMRAADAAEKVTRKQRRLLDPYKKELLGLLTEAQEQELRWHLAVMVPRLLLDPKEQQLAMSSLDRYLGLADLAETEPSFRPRVVETLREAARKGTPAMRARSRKLLIHLESI